MQKGVPQIMDITSIKSVLHDLSEKVLPSRFETAQQPEPNIIQFCLRGLNSQTWIEVSWNSDFARILKINRPAKIGAESTLSRQLTCGLKYRTGPPYQHHLNVWPSGSMGVRQSMPTCEKPYL